MRERTQENGVVRRTFSRKFTLIELLVVVATIAILTNSKLRFFCCFLPFLQCDEKLLRFIYISNNQTQYVTSLQTTFLSFRLITSTSKFSPSVERKKRGNFFEAEKYFPVSVCK